MLYTTQHCKNDVVSSVMEVFVLTDEYIKAYDSANVKQGDNQAKLHSV